MRQPKKPTTKRAPKINNDAKTAAAEELSEEQLEQVAGGSFQWGVSNTATVAGGTPLPQACANGKHFD